MESVGLIIEMNDPQVQIVKLTSLRLCADVQIIYVPNSVGYIPRDLIRKIAFGNMMRNLIWENGPGLATDSIDGYIADQLGFPDAH